MDFTIECDNIEASGRSSSRIKAGITGANLSDLIRDVGVEDLLEEIGKDACIKHFDIEEAE